jgi:glucose/arabinose dehydrogenase
MTIRFSLLKLVVAVVLIAEGTSASAQIGTRLVTAGIVEPTYITSASHDANTLYALEKGGTIKQVNASTGATSTWLDLSGLVNNVGHEGLHGFVFDPNYESNGRFYVQYTNTSHQETLQRYTSTWSGFTSETLYTVTPDHLVYTGYVGTHYAGWLGFGADGMLYSSLGDGSGFAWDPENRAQTITELPENKHFLGKILRLDVSTTTGYAVPSDNPFGNEIYAYGLRDPWRVSFDRQTGDIWIGDVGQYSYEEINHASLAELSGMNFGWHYKEGFHEASAGTPPGGLTDPVFEYDHTVGDSITGGYVYRGAIEELQGQYFFADFIAGRVWSLDSENPGGGLTEWTDMFNNTGGHLDYIVSFGEDANGELYIVDYDGQIFQVVPEPSSALLVVGGAMAMLLGRRRR